MPNDKRQISKNEDLVFVLSLTFILSSLSFTIRSMKILVFGAKGFMGGLFLEAFTGSVGSFADIADQSAVRAALQEVKPDVVVNAAGKTGKPNVDWCEDHKEETVRANVTGPLILLEECTKIGARLVHLSSGCIYAGDNGGRGFSEEDAPNFDGSFYARTKAWSDQILKEFPVLLLRIRMPFDGSLHPRTLVGKLAKYSRVLDERNSITYVPDFIDAAKQLIEKGKTGIYNVTNPGTISPYEIMSLYKEVVDPSHSFERLTVVNLGEVVKAGRSNCTLSTARLEGEGIVLRPVEEAVKDAMRIIAQSRQPVAA
jgi:3,5-epimerase/4-reductase